MVVGKCSKSSLPDQDTHGASNVELLQSFSLHSGGTPLID